MESYKDQKARDQDRPLWTWTAESLDEVQGHQIPLKSRMISYTASQEPSFEWAYRILSVEFDKDFPATTFWPAMQPGVGVMDTMTSKGYDVPGGQKDARTDPVSTTVALIEATPPVGPCSPSGL